LRSNIFLDEMVVEDLRHHLQGLAKRNPSSPFVDALDAALRSALIRLRIQLETDNLVETKMRADLEAINIFATNLKELLLAAPFGRKGVLGIDPGLRTGCKVCIINDVGTYIEDNVLYLVGSDAKKQEL